MELPNYIFENIGEVMKALAVLFLFGLIVDYPEQRRKKRARIKNNCESGSHVFTFWEFDYTIGYNDKDVYRRHCKHCKKQQFTISRLHPLDDVVHTFDKL